MKHLIELWPVDWEDHLGFMNEMNEAVSDEENNITSREGVGGQRFSKK